MAGVWHRYDPELLEAYAIACPLLEKGSPRVQVLGDNTVRLICYGGKRAILPPVYVTGVPTEWIKRFRESKKDLEEFVLAESDKAPYVVELLHGLKLGLREKRELAKDAYEDFSKLRAEDPQAEYRLDLTKQMLKAFLER